MNIKYIEKTFIDGLKAMVCGRHYKDENQQVYYKLKLHGKGNGYDVGCIFC